MNLPQWSRWSARLTWFAVLLVTAGAVAQLVDPNRTRPLWELLLLPSGVLCGAASLLVLRDAPAVSPRRQRWATALGVLCLALGLIGLYVQVFVRGAGVAI